MRRKPVPVAVGSTVRAAFGTPPATGTVVAVHADGTVSVRWDCSWTHPSLARPCDLEVVPQEVRRGR